MKQEYKDAYKLFIDDGDILITLKQACRLLNVGRNTLLELAKIKGFPAIKSKGKIWIDKTELPNWIKKNYGNYRN